MSTLPTPTTLLTSLLASLPPSPTPTPTPPPPTAATNPLLNAPPHTKPLLLTLHALFPHEFLPALDLLDRHLVTRLIIRPNTDLSQAEHGPTATDLPLADGVGAAGHGDEAMTGTGTGTGTDGAEGEGNGDGNGRTEEAGRWGDGTRNEVYYVQSAAAAATGSRGRGGQGRYGRRSVGLEMEGKSYEVRVRGWNCSCPAFAFAAFGSGAAVARAGCAGDDVGAALGGGGGGDAVDGGGGEEGGEWRFGGLSSLWGAGGEAVPVCKHLLACVVGERCGLLAGFVEERVVGRGEGAGLGAGWSG